MCNNGSLFIAPYAQSGTIDHPIIIEPVEVSILCNTPSPSTSSSPSPLHEDPLTAVHQPSTPPNNKSHRRKRDAGYIPRPRNAFIVFRSEFIRCHRDVGEGQQNELSKLAGKSWKQMSKEEKKPFEDVAHYEKRVHKLKYPDYQYTPGPRRASSASRPKTTKAATRRANATSATSSRARRALAPVGEVWTPPSSSSSPGSYSPEYTPSRDASVPRAAAHVAVRHLEQIAAVASPDASSPSASYLPSPEMRLQQVGSTTLFQEFVPVEESSGLDVDLAWQREVEHETIPPPRFVPQGFYHPSLGFQVTFPFASPPTLPRSPFSSPSGVNAFMCDYNTPPLSPDLAYPLAGEVHQSEMLPRELDGYGYGRDNVESYTDSGLSSLDDYYRLTLEPSLMF